MPKTSPHPKVFHVKASGVMHLVQVSNPRPCSHDISSIDGQFLLCKFLMRACTSCGWPCVVNQMTLLHCCSISAFSKPWDEAIVATSSKVIYGTSWSHSDDIHSLVSKSGGQREGPVITTRPPLFTIEKTVESNSLSNFATPPKSSDHPEQSARRDQAF